MAARSTLRQFAVYAAGLWSGKFHAPKCLSPALLLSVHTRQSSHGQKDVL